MSNHSTPTRISVAREGFKKEQEKFSKPQIKQGCKTASKKQMMFSISKNTLLKTEFLHGFPYKQKPIVIKL